MNPCRICDNPKVAPFLDLGATPLANSFLKREELSGPESRFPLQVVFCDTCGLVQLDHVVPPEVMFRSYIYVSSTSQTMPAHFSAYADDVVSRGRRSPEDLFVEIGSNDGCLLRALKKHEARILGVEPATNLAAIANAEGLTTVNDFFCERSAIAIRESEGPAKVVIGNNVLAHVSDLKGLMNGLDALLRPDGVGVFEVPYLVDLLEKCEFDTIYHEHLSYFSVGALQRLFSSKGFQVHDVKRVPVHGGSIRVYVSRTGIGSDPLPSVSELLALEKRENLSSLQTYNAFATQVGLSKRKNRSLLSKLKESGARIAAYGAPAKGNTLLNYFEIGNELLDYVVDRSAYKQGMYTPGTHIPVVPPSRLLKDQPDYVLVLAWNFIEEIMDQQEEYLSRGGKFIVPIPEPRIMQQHEFAPGASGRQ
jgi:hypothetical protein